MRKLFILIGLVTALSTSQARAGVEKGINVAQVQKMLTELCFNPGPVDGAWGRKTETAFEEFYKPYGKYDGTFDKFEMRILIGQHRGTSNTKKCGSQIFDPNSVVKQQTAANEATRAGVGEIHRTLLRKSSKIRFGTPADPKMITLGPKKLEQYFDEMPPYNGKTSINIKMPLGTKVIAPMDMQFIGYKNRNADFRKTSSGILKPFDDLELCFHSVERNPAVVMCAYHLKTSPLLPKMFKNAKCNTRQDWDVGDAGVSKAGLIFYEKNTSEYSYLGPNADDCGAVLGKKIRRGQVIGISGAVGKNPHTGFRFKVRNSQRNNLASTNKIYDVKYHWVQPTIFFDWVCFKPNQNFSKQMMTYPFSCKDA